MFILYLRVRTCAYVSACGVEMLTSDVSLSCSSPYILRQGLSLNLEIAYHPALTGVSDACFDPLAFARFCIAAELK